MDWDGLSYCHGVQSQLDAMLDGGQQVLICFRLNVFNIAPSLLWYPWILLVSFGLHNCFLLSLSPIMAYLLTVLMSGNGELA